jgi:glycosyltransferase involved in cell wall biosynthesis
MPIRWHEPFGMVMIEAMAAGTPVVALNRGSVPEVVRHGRTGWICDHESDLAAALARVGELTPDDCVAHATAAFSADLMACRYEQVYRHVIAQTCRTRRSTRHELAVPPVRKLSLAGNRGPAARQRQPGRLSP